MNLVDLATLLLVVWFGARGYAKGLVREGLEAASALGGVVLAARTHEALGDAVTIYTGLPIGVTRPVMYGAVAVSATAIGFFVISLIRRFLPKRERMRRFDDLGGLAFGVLKGFFFAALLVILAAQVPAATLTRALDRSAFGRAVFVLAPAVYQRLGD